MFLLTFYVPKKQCEQVKNALFDIGAGCYGKYRKCCWQTEGVGQFLPLSGSHPFLGDIGKSKKIKEIKVEMICEDITKAIDALLSSHPYEEPVYCIVRMETVFKEEIN